MRLHSFILICVAIASAGVIAQTAPLTTTAPTTIATTTPSTAPTSRPTFDVKDNGATGDGQTIDTQAIQKTIDQCATAGGGVVVIPSGTYRSGSLFLKSHVTLQVSKDALLQGSTDETDYPIIDTRVAGLEMKHPAALVNAIDCDDVAVVGAGTIDGSGQHWWDIFWATARARGRGVDFQILRPRLVCFTRCTNVHVVGLSLKNPPFWNLHILYCKTVDIDGLTIRAPSPHKAPSSDGIDIDSSSDVRISRCDISCDDDDIVIKSGRDADGLRVNKPSENIVISDCTIGEGQGISMGSETAGGIRNVIVRSCTFTNSGSAAKIKSMPGRGGVIENITYEDITATNVASPLEINLSWGGSDWKKFVDPKLAAPVPEDIGTPKVRNITFRNFTASATMGPRPSSPTRAGMISGLPNSPITDVTFENVWISAQRGMTISNAPNLKLDGLTIEAKEGPNLIRRDTTAPSSTTQPAPAGK
jgi:polygalacturonase